MILSEEDWQRLLPKLRERCPRLTPDDLAGCERRTDLLESRIQYRQWISRRDARLVIAELLGQLGLVART